MTSKPKSTTNKKGKSRSICKTVECPSEGAVAAPKETKLDLIINLLSRPEGATIEDMVTATGWQKHSVRGVMSNALTKKRSLQIVSDKPQGGSRIYKIAGGDHE